MTEVAVFLPEVRAIEPTSPEGTSLRLGLFVPDNVAHFAGHFPGLPVLPGVVQVDWAHHFARTHLPLRGQFKALDNLKFLALVLPGTSLNLTLKWDATKAQLDFAFASPERKFSSGRLLFSPTA